MLVAEFAENEEAIFQQTVKWLSSKLTSVPTFIEQPIVRFQIDPFTKTYTSESGENVYLTAKEFDLLYFLFCYKGQVFTKDQLYENVWGFHNAPEGSNLTSFIQKLRKKIEPSPDNPQYILTVWGVGYKFNEEKP
ncbi:TPA: winged helix-turn-helix domain-containing protein [Clostridioides difficile]|uniref:winged helix-turn-helix domain-containing protein n=1 Tax=Clostridioides difficile TaxID=1496 RepID=UPI000D1D6B17|nr:helix-turn-helix domain-containing protein [Clostridioides difficile]HBG8731854.1 winged helix-turn-helix domain-containing protein [Clostridioides difficile]HBG8772895.1 winged helix-turn-helix domain-containing protein [Clostridioides difficile]HBG9087971.1 winged helix-turn-helix domain-containing protein [Clostridioides difficile]HBG9113814.1 winged helix-turn-helix domain-containing protein [Clostridioides difficile]HBG9120861.1 winged helix-turn-helix domain-containing protein [Clostr